VQPLVYYVFDVMILAGKDVMSEPTASRRDLLRAKGLSRLGEPIRKSPVFDVGLPELIQSVKAQVGAVAPVKQEINRTVLLQALNLGETRRPETGADQGWYNGGWPSEARFHSAAPS
jgi:hypothetical protein